MKKYTAFTENITYYRIYICSTQKKWRILFWGWFGRRGKTSV